MTLQLALGLVLCLGIGLSLGLIGGGSIITVPVLVYALGVEPREAVAMLLAVVGVTSLIGAALHHRGAVRVPAAAAFAGAGVVSSFLGAQLTYLVSPEVLLLSFAALMLAAGIRMAITGGRPLKERRPARPVQVILAGLAVVLLTGFLGVGGGFLVVLALVLFAGLEMREAVGTSLLVISINAAAGLAGHLANGGFHVPLALLVTALAVAGTLVGTHFSHRISPVTLRRAFSVFVIGVAVFLVAANLEAVGMSR